MAELVIVDNPDVELSTVVDIDAFRTLPVVSAGPDRESILKAFINSTPFDITALDDAAIRTAYLSFLDAMGKLGPTAPETDATPPVEPNGGVGGDDAAQAVREAHDAAGAPPEPAPADTDLEPDVRTETRRVKCFNCNGDGTITFGDGTPPVVCNVCGGKQYTEQEVPV